VSSESRTGVASVQCLPTGQLWNRHQPSSGRWPCPPDARSCAGADGLDRRKAAPIASGRRRRCCCFAMPPTVVGAWGRVVPRTELPGGRRVI